MMAVTIITTNKPIPRLRPKIKAKFVDDDYDLETVIH